MYLKYKALKWAAIASCGLTANHLYVSAYSSMAGRIGDCMTNYKSSIVTELATKAGFARVEPEKPLPVLARESAIRYRINPSVFLALVHVESGGNPFALSSAGAIGPAQVMPFNYKRCGLKSAGELLDPRRNLDCGARILSEELSASGDLPIALQRYNGGPRCVNRCQESIRYASKVLTRLARDVSMETITDDDRRELDSLIENL